MKKLRKFLLYNIYIGFAVLAFLYAYWKIDPVSFRLHVFQPARELLFFKNELHVLSDWSKIQKTVLPQPRTVAFPYTRKSTLSLAGDLYLPQAARAPAIILLHGSYPWAKREALIRFMAERLQKSGWIVIVPDSRGFADSADPARPYAAGSWSVKADINRVIRYITHLPQYDKNNLFILGHSMGANHALEGGLDHPKVRGLILIGPGRYIENQVEDISFWDRVRFSADRGLDEPVPEAVIKARRRVGNFEQLATTRLTVNHQPILLIDGEQEGQAKLKYVREAIKGIVPPFEYHTIRQAGHYCGVRSFYGGDTIYYREDLFSACQSVVMDFLHKYIAKNE